MRQELQVSLAIEKFPRPGKNHWVFWSFRLAGTKRTGGSYV